MSTRIRKPYANYMGWTILRIRNPMFFIWWKAWYSPYLLYHPDDKRWPYPNKIWGQIACSPRLGPERMN